MHHDIDLNQILPFVRKPARYVGGEHNSAGKNWDRAEVRFALVFPDLYEIGMAHQGLQILHHILNSKEHLLAERCYVPDLDMEQQLRRHRQPLFSLESRRPLAEFDVLGITLPYELCYTNILTVLDLAAIPFRAGQRDREPLVIGGGSCAMNPEPVADFFDAIVLGDGEEAILEIAAVVCAAKKACLPRPELLARLAALDGVYVPSFFVPQYTDGEFTGMQALDPGRPSVRRRVLRELPAAESLGKPLVPVVRPVHDRLGVEIARGCTRGCRFCQAGMIYRPVRERSIAEVMAVAEQGTLASGFEEMALLSLSTGDYSCLSELMTALMNRFAHSHVSVSMPSMRVGTLTPGIMDQIRRVRKTGFTVAPEAGTDRLRQVINKGISEADLLSTCRNAFSMGWKLIKFYFMIGLPTETWEDVEAIIDLAAKARREAGPAAGRVQINVSVGTFVPKPHTPFQWERQLSLAEARERIGRLKEMLPRRGFNLKWQDPEQSVMEGVFSRGDRRLANLIESAWMAGVRLDGWSEHFRLEAWRDAARACDVDIDAMLHPRDPSKPLPWDHLASGVDREFLIKERARALIREYTPDCRTSGCQQCGLCDFKTIRPVLHCSGQPAAAEVREIPENEAAEVGGPPVVYRVHYTRLDDSRFYSHLETLQLIFRALRRARVSVLHSRGYHPTPRVSFSAALPVGMESETEYFDMKVALPLNDTEKLAVDLGRELAPGMRVTGVEIAPAREPEAYLTSFKVTADTQLQDDVATRIADFLARDTFMIEQIRKNKRRSLDIRPLVKSLHFEKRTICFELVAYQARPGVSPREILQEVIGLSERETLLARMKKTKSIAFGANT
ncbi:MAG TPA: TIGR03960 family B12-binding radical SAM protein [Desulfobulbaceae bacterium]|nr:TIGR03960 family B12-binding radical SAM protein [Desulfobulbaceae bacterium]